VNSSAGTGELVPLLVVTVMSTVPVPAGDTATMALFLRVPTPFIWTAYPALPPGSSRPVSHQSTWHDRMRIRQRYGAKEMPRDSHIG
jgi:hypothetical protein